MSAENLIKQYEKYCEVLKKVISEDAVTSLTEAIGERLVVCPRGTTLDDGGAPGALVDFSLKVATTAKAMSKHFGDTKSLVKVSLLHELGKLGDLEEGKDLFVPQESEWHQEKLGQMFKYMPENERSTQNTVDSFIARYQSYERRVDGNKCLARIALARKSILCIIY